MPKNKLVVLSNVVDQCSSEQFKSVFAPLSELPPNCSKAEMISHCFNKELAAYGIKSYPSPDKTQIFINDEEMCKVLDFFKNKGYRPYISTEHVQRLQTLQKVSNDNHIDLLWAQSGGKKIYYYMRQYGFNGANLYNALNLNTANSAAAVASGTGAATLQMSGIVALSWSGSLFLSILENYIPNSMPRVKATVSGAKVIIAFPIRLVEWSVNQVFGVAEGAITGTPLPTNVTEVYRLNQGPKLKDLPQVRNSTINWAIEQKN